MRNKNENADEGEVELKPRPQSRGAVSRERIIRATSVLLESKGFHAAGMAEIVRESGAPKGSVYYHFPGGKEEIAAKIGSVLAGNEDPAEAIYSLVSGIASRIEKSGFKSGELLTIVAAETANSSERVNAACREAYDLMRAEFRAKLLSSGCDPVRAEGLAVTVMSAIEGATVLSRTHRSGDSLRAVAADLRTLVRTGRNTNESS